MLAAGGFPEELAPLQASAIGHAGAARLAAFGELSPEVCAATREQVGDLVEREELAQSALSTLDILASAEGKASAADMEPLLKASAEIIAACALT